MESVFRCGAARKKSEGARNRVFRIIPRLAVVAVVEFLAEPGDVAAKLGDIRLFDLARGLEVFGEILFGKLVSAVFEKLSVVGQTKIFLTLELFAELIVRFPKIDHVIEHFEQGIVHTVADITGIVKGLELVLLLGAFAVEESAPFKNLFFNLGKMALEDQGKSETVSVFEKLFEMVLAEALFVRLDADIGLHHGSTHNDLDFVFFKHCLQKAEGAVVGFPCNCVLKGLVDRYGINCFSHGVILSLRP